MDNISEHITYQEAVHNNHGFANKPDEPTLIRMRYLAKTVFEPVRLFINMAIFVSSFYRCLILNKHIKGAYGSQHTKGEAMDLQCAGNNAKIFFYILQHLDFDQLIWEFGDYKEPAWVHVSKIQGVNRKQALRSIIEKNEKGEDVTKYIPFIV